jgi:N-acetylmuramic acid 6-phosphate etherase
MIERRNPRSVDIDLFPTERILKIINAEDAQVAAIVAAAIPEIVPVVNQAVSTIKSSGRIFYVGAGTSGRLAVVDAAECPPTFGTPAEWIQAVMAGGTKAFVQAKENGEDDREQAAADLKPKKICANDLVIGVAASGTTPYTLAALEYAKSRGARTAAVVAVPNSTMAGIVDFTICTAVGAEVITGSTRMKAGTALKMVLNMISTAVMIRLGMTYSNWMINVSMTNDKLRERGMQILHEILGTNEDETRKLVEQSGGNLKLAVIMGALTCDRRKAEELLAANDGNLRKIIAHLGSGRE